jgi:hypothetical protein
MSKPQNLQRVAFSPGEFAALFGKSQTWGYRQLYSGKVKAITEHGRTLIPAAEVERILATAGIYEGIKPKEKTKESFQKLAPKLGGAWQRYLSQRRETGEKKAAAQTAVNSSAARGRLPWAGKLRGEALTRMGGQRSAKQGGGI